MMLFSSDKASFGRHETFPLRYGWLTKGFQALVEDPKAFESENATVALGVGRNMVNAIRYWLQACQIVERVDGRFRGTPVGLAVFDENGYDPYLEDEATIWLIHWLLSTNSELATAWYWFFNRYHKPEFTSQEVATSLLDFANAELATKFSPSTVKLDASIVLRMYVRSKGNTRTPLEEALDSPLSLLDLVTALPGTKTYRSRPGLREGLPDGIFGYAIAELFQASGVSEIPIEEVMYGKPGYPAVGAVFRLTESALLTKLERIIRMLPGVFELRETAGLHQVYLLSKVRSLAFLEHHYMVERQEVAA